MSNIKALTAQYGVQTELYNRKCQTELYKMLTKWLQSEMRQMEIIRFFFFAVR